MALRLYGHWQLNLGDEMTFRYEGFTSKQEVKRGYIDAQTDGDAAEELRKMGIFLNKLEQDSQTPMKTVLVGGESLPESKPESKPVKDGVFPAKRNPDLCSKCEGTCVEPGRTNVLCSRCDGSGIEPKDEPAEAPPDWRSEFRANLGTIRSIFDQLNQEKFDGFNSGLVGIAKEEAETELLKSAMIRAVKSAMTA